MSDILDDVRRRKRKAMDLRDLGDFKGAFAELDEAAKVLKVALEGSSHTDSDAIKEVEKEYATTLAQILGSVGGLHRRQQAYTASLASYVEAYAIEKDARYGIVDSYALVQRLIARLLEEPQRYLEGTLDLEEGGKCTAFASTIQHATIVVQEQLNGTRNGDPWARADRGTLRFLAGEPATGAWTDLDVEPNPSPYVIEATVSMMKDVERRFESLRHARAESEVRRIQEFIEALEDIETS